MILKSKALAIILVTLIFGGIMLSTGMNWWQTQSDKTPAKYSDGEFAGEFDPSDIRGSYSLGDIENNFEIPINILLEAFGIPNDLEASSLRISEMEALFSGYEFEVGTSSVRLFVAWYLGLPIEITEDIYIPQSATDILIHTTSLSQEQIDYLQGHSIIMISVIMPELSDAPPIADHLPANSIDMTIKGKTTFREVLDWGLTTEQIETALGNMKFNPLENIKDFCQANGLEFGTVKLALQAELEKLP